VCRGSIHGLQESGCRHAEEAVRLFKKELKAAPLDALDPRISTGRLKIKKLRLEVIVPPKQTESCMARGPEDLFEIALDVEARVSLDMERIESDPFIGSASR